MHSSTPPPFCRAPSRVTPRSGGRAAILALAALAPLALLLARCGDDDGAADAGLPDAGPRCGNGVVEPGEQCDDGNDDNRDGCCNTCRWCPVCDTNAFIACDATSVCCPTTEDVPTECAAAAQGEARRCLPACDGPADCYWSNRCDAAFPGHCSEAWCGPAEDGSRTNGPCDVNGETGYCYPLGRAESDYGLCIEPGPLPPGAACAAGFPLDAIPRHVQPCDAGVCTHWRSGRAPQCLAFCDPVAAYDATGVQPGGCPAGTNCLSFSSLSSYSGKRLADKGRCVHTPATDPDGLLACDLLTGALIADRAQRCAERLPDTRCGLYRTGSLMGTCQSADASPLPLGAPCSADATALPCGEAALCVRADYFGTADATELACLAVCDAADPGWDCVDAGGAVGLQCTSLSHGTEDASPTRLGLCAPPPVQGQ